LIKEHHIQDFMSILASVDI